MTEIKRDLTDTRKEGLDKFYTTSACSKKCIDTIFGLYDIPKWDLIVEPSSGDGSFFNQIPTDKKVGLDIAPEHEDIIKMDFFNYNPPSDKKNIMVLGNPPFSGSLAVHFFNHSAKWANVIAFIIPRTFRKRSIINRLNKNFHLVYDDELPTTPCCFTPKMSVKCCFQIWERRDIERPKITFPKKHNDWEFLKTGSGNTIGQPESSLDADLAIRAFGGLVGEIRVDNFNELTTRSWLWVKSNISLNILVKRLSQLDYSCGMNTARQNSLCQYEIVALYSEKY